MPLRSFEDGREALSEATLGEPVGPLRTASSGILWGPFGGFGNTFEAPAVVVFGAAFGASGSAFGGLEAPSEDAFRTTFGAP